MRQRAALGARLVAAALDELLEELEVSAILRTGDSEHRMPDPLTGTRNGFRIDHEGDARPGALRREGEEGGTPGLCVAP